VGIKRNGALVKVTTATRERKLQASTNIYPLCCPNCAQVIFDHSFVVVDYQHTLDSALEGLKEGFALPEIFELKLSNRTTANAKVYMTTNRTVYDYLRATQCDFQKVETSY
jgi:hypothetical protein